MGQYYKIAFKTGDNKAVVNDRKYTGSDYIMAKLMEHSYLGNTLCKAVANVLTEGKTRLAWIGDYAEDDEVKAATNGELDMKEVWDTEHGHEFKKRDFDYSHKFLVNHTKGVYISLDDYVAKSRSEWRICPFSLLTAIGNGRGGGDYYGENEDRVGTWAWDEISIEDREPEGLEKHDIVFNEDR